MNKFKFYFLLAFSSLTLFSCHKDDDSKEPLRDYAEQYAKDIDSIEGYLKTHYIIPTTTDGLPDVKISEIPVGGTQVSIWENQVYPLHFKMVKSDKRISTNVDGEGDDPVNYKLYYLILNEGGGKNASTMDSTFVSYRGWELNDDEFDKNSNPLWFTYEGTAVSGFRQFWPLLKTAESTTIGDDGVVTYHNFGAGVVFIPSGLAYYSAAQSGFAAYSPLVFTLRVHSLKYRDHDRDGILDKDEDLDANGNNFNDDTDGDNIPDFIDLDDDGDGFKTKYEITKPTGSTGRALYPFDPIPSENELLGVPDCSGDGTSPTRLRKYRDPSCH